MLLDRARPRPSQTRIRSGEFQVTGVEDKPYTTKPYAPFTTSTLQQEANRKLGFTARAHDAGGPEPVRKRPHHLHAHRFDQPGQRGDRGRAATWWNATTAASTCPNQPRLYRTKVKNAQEAHEAIRPAGHPFELPEAMRSQLGADEFQLFELIWKRTIASQMADARGRRISITIEGEGCVFQVSGKTIDFPGYLRAYVEGSDDPEAELADQERVLPSVERGEKLHVHVARSQRAHHAAAGALQRSRADQGPGRDRHRPAQHLRLDHRHDPGPQLRVQEGRAPWCPPGWRSPWCNCLEEHLPALVDYQFTAQMEDDLDAISRGEQEHVRLPRELLFRQRHAGPEEAARQQGRRDRPRDDRPHPHRQARGRSRRSSCASAATGRSSSRATAPRRFPKTCRRTN